MSDVVADAPPSGLPGPAAAAVTDRVAQHPSAVSDQAAAQRTFSTAMLVSATRCLLTYIVLPFVAPALGFATGVGPGVGIVIGVVAIVANLITIRRFHKAQHRLRWWYSAVAACVLGLLLVLMVQDITRLL